MRWTQSITIRQWVGLLVVCYFTVGLNELTDNQCAETDSYCYSVLNGFILSSNSMDDIWGFLFNIYFTIICHLFIDLNVLLLSKCTLSSLWFVHPSPQSLCHTSGGYFSCRHTIKPDVDWLLLQFVGVVTTLRSWGR